MKKRREERLAGRSLPEPARCWLDAYKAEMTARAKADPQLQPFYERLEALAASLQLPDYSVKAFRDLHYLRFPESSVAGLAVSDELFLDILWAGVYTISDLEQKLESGEICPETLRSVAENRNGQGMKKLWQALTEWQLSHENTPGETPEI